MKKLFATRRRKVAAVAILAILIAASAAMAAWLVTSNQGAGKARAGSLSAVTLETTLGNVSYPATGTARPGDPLDVTVKVTNPAANGALTIVSAKLNGATITPSGVGCGTGDFSPVNLTGLSIPLPVGTQEIVIPGLIKMSATAPSACQGNTIDINASGGVTITAATP